MANARKKRAEEWLKCKVNPKYFIHNYVKIVHQKRGIIAFDMFDFQERALSDLFNYDYTISLKARQMGMTTLLSAYALWLMIFQENKEVLALSYKQNKARNIIKKIKRMNSHLPSWMKESTPIDNQLEVEFGNGSKASAESTTSDAGRSESASFVIIDEAAFIDNASEVWSAVKLTLDVGGGTCAVLSTPTGVGTWFHETWQQATSGNRIKKKSNDPEIWKGVGENDFHPIKLHWSLHPERDQKWREEQTRTMGEKKAARECFSGDTRIYTGSGPKLIKNVEVGDKVLTHKGRFRKVKRTFSKKDKARSFSTSKNYVERKVTDDHPILNKNEEWKNFSETETAIQFPKTVENDDWNVVSEFDVSEIDYDGRFLLVEKDKKVHLSDRHKVKVNNSIKIDEDFGYVVGLFLADGYKKPNNRRIVFSHDKDDNWPTKVGDIISSKFGIEKFQRRKVEGRARHFSVCNKIVSLVFDKFTKTGKGKNKGLSEESYNFGSYEFFRGVINGLMKGDGCLTNAANKQINNISEIIIDDLKYLSAILNQTGVSKKIRDRRRETSEIYGRNVEYNEKTYVASFLKTKNKNVDEISEVFDDENSQSVCNIEKGDDVEEIVVYNLEIEEDHSYVTEHFVAHNCDCDFSTSGDTVIDQQIIRWYEKMATEEPMERHRRGKGEVHVWEPPETGKTYIMASDVARGDSGDYSTFVIYKAVEMEQVAEYKGKMPPSEFGDLLYSYGSMYNDALLVIERDSYGWAAMQRVIDRDYPNLLYTSNDLKLVEIDEDKTTGRSKKMNPGLDTNRTTRSLIISSLQRFMRKKWIRPKSERFTEELQTFIWKNHGTRQKPEHMDGYNDDLVFATAFACWARDKALKYRAEMGQRSEKSLDNVKGSKLVFSGNGGPEDPYTQDMGGHKEDMRWLFS
jgi:hypothetical protein